MGYLCRNKEGLAWQCTISHAELAAVELDHFGAQHQNI